MSGAARAVAGALLGVAASALLVANTAARHKDTDLAEMSAFRRLWSDLALGVAGYVEAEYPIPPDRASRKTWAVDPVAATHRIVEEKVGQLDIRPWQFWRVVRDEPFVRERVAARPGAYDDLGRGLVLAAAFRARGGIAPFLILWLATLCALPVLVWIAWEAVRAGFAVAGAVFLLLLGLSPYVVESFSLVRTAVGFYLLALLLVVPLGLHGLLGPPPTRRGLIGRWLAAGLVFGVCALCRSGSLFIVPGLLILLAASVTRLSPQAVRLPAAAVSLVLFLAPFALLRPPQHHDIWGALWEGLGDFDRTKGHVWSDPVADERVRRAGTPGLLSDEGMAVLRADVVDHVRGDPAWYAAILARRVLATVSQSRLWPTVRGDGLWMRRSSSPNEGFMDKYYTYTATADFLGFGARTVEVPIALLILPTAVLLAWAGADRRLRGPAGLTLAVMAGALPLPVLITTAGGTETQAFVVAYLLGASFLADALAKRAIRNRMDSTGRIHGTPAPEAPHGS